MSRRIQFVLFLSIAVVIAAGVVQAEEPPSGEPASAPTTAPASAPTSAPASAPASAPTNASSAETRALLKEFRPIEKAIDQEFAPCKVCGGKGKVKQARCEPCAGTGEAFHGDYQEFIDQYIAYCDLMTTHAAALEADAKAKEQVEGHRKQYLAFIERNMGARTIKQKVAKGPREVGYGKSETLDSQYNGLACDIMKATKEKPVGHGIAFNGRVARVLTRAGGAALAEVQLKTAAGAERIRYVLVPADAAWAEKSRIHVIGKIIDGTAERAAFGLKDDAIVVATYPGTE